MTPVDAASQKVYSLTVQAATPQSFHLIIPGQPVAQGRPRFFRRGNFVGTYDPETSRTWKQHVQRTAELMKPPILTGPLRMIVTFHLRKPKSRKKSEVWPVMKPDLSNFLKAIEDSLSGVLYKDDSAIVEILARKVYAGGEPCVEILVESLAS